MSQVEGFSYSSSLLRSTYAIQFQIFYQMLLGLSYSQISSRASIPAFPVKRCRSWGGSHWVRRITFHPIKNTLFSETMKLGAFQHQIVVGQTNALRGGRLELTK